MEKRTFCCYRIYILRLTSFKHSMSSLCSVFKCSPRETQRKVRNFMSLNFNIKGVKLIQFSYIPVSEIDDLRSKEESCPPWAIVN